MHAGIQSNPQSLLAPPTPRYSSYLNQKLVALAQRVPQNQHVANLVAGVGWRQADYVGTVLLFWGLHVN